MAHQTEQNFSPGSYQFSGMDCSTSSYPYVDLLDGLSDEVRNALCAAHPDARRRAKVGLSGNPSFGDFGPGVGISGVAGMMSTDEHFDDSPIPYHNPRSSYNLYGPSIDSQHQVAPQVAYGEISVAQSLHAVAIQLGNGGSPPSSVLLTEETKAASGIVCNGNDDTEEEDNLENLDKSNQVGAQSFKAYSYQYEDDQPYGFSRSIADLHHYKQLQMQRLMDEHAAIDESLRGVSHEDQLKHAKQIFDAIVNLDGVIDKPGKKKPAQAVLAFIEKSYTPELLEQVAWDLYSRTVRAHVGRVTRMDVAKGKSRSRESFDSVQERVDYVVFGLSQSKAMVKQLCDVPYIDRLADAPHTEIRMKHNNKKINEKRDEENALGRSAQKAGITMEKLTPPIAANGSPISKARKESAQVPRKRKHAAALNREVEEYLEKAEQSSPPEIVGQTLKRRNTGNRGKPAPTPTPAINRVSQTPSVNRSMRERKRQPVYTNSSDGARKSSSESSGSEWNESSGGSHDGSLDGSLGDGGALLFNPSGVSSPLEHFQCTTPINHPDFQAPNPSYSASQTAISGMVSFGPVVTPDYAGAHQTPTEHDHKLTLCKILDIRSHLADEINLEKLRIYARAYDQRHQFDHWIIFSDDKTYAFKSNSGPFGVAIKQDGSRMIMPNGFVAPELHFAAIFMEDLDYKKIAVARGDSFYEAETGYTKYPEEFYPLNSFDSEGKYNDALGY